MGQGMATYEVIIVGGGPAGLTAGLYASRAGLNSLLAERGAFGGQMANTPLVENYPGFPEGISGSELGSLMHRQGIRYGLEVAITEVTGIAERQVYTVSTSEGDIEGATVIIAAGSVHRTLRVPGEERLSGRGVSCCATCDGFFFRDREVAVVGGGDVAITDALELAQLARKVTVIHRRDELRAEQALQERAVAHPDLEFAWDTVVEEVLGAEAVEGLKLRNVKTDKRSILKVDGLFVAIGLSPNSQPFSDVVELDDAGCILTDETMGTSRDGVFAAGDIRSNSRCQITAAVSDGTAAAMSAFEYVQRMRRRG